MSNTEPNIIKEFRALYNYIRLMGEHVIQIHQRLEDIEKNINELSVNHRNLIIANMSEISNIKENMVKQYDFNDFIDKMRTSVSEILPLLPMFTKGNIPTEGIRVVEKKLKKVIQD